MAEVCALLSAFVEQLDKSCWLYFDSPIPKVKVVKKSARFGCFSLLIKDMHFCVCEVSEQTGRMMILFMH